MLTPAHADRLMEDGSEKQQLDLKIQYSARFIGKGGYWTICTMLMEEILHQLISSLSR